MPAAIGPSRSAAGSRAHTRTAVVTTEIAMSAANWLVRDTVANGSARPALTGRSAGDVDVISLYNTTQHREDDIHRKGMHFPGDAGRRVLGEHDLVTSLMGLTCG